MYADMIFGRRSVMTRMVIPHGHAYPLFIFKLTSIKHLSLITHQQSRCLDDDRVISTVIRISLLPIIPISCIHYSHRLKDLMFQPPMGLAGSILHQVTVCRTSGSLLFHCFAQPLRNSFRSTKEVWPARTPWQGETPTGTLLCPPQMA